MAVSRPTIDVQQRNEFGTRVTRRLRKQGLVPGVVYGTPEGDSIAFSVEQRTLRRVLVGSGALIDLTVDGDTRPVIVKDQQFHPVRGELIHIDFVQVRLDEKIQTQVAVHVQGTEEAPGVKEGGVLEQATHQLNIEALPTAIPDAIVVDVSGLGIADTMHLSAVTPPEGVTFLDDPEETIIATIVVPTEEPEEPEVEEEAEVVGEEAEGEAAAEGATGEEAEQAREAAAARSRGRHPRRDRPAVRPRREPPGRRAGRPQRAEVAARGPRRARFPAHPRGRRPPRFDRSGDRRRLRPFEVLGDA